MAVMRESWTDERLDDFRGRVEHRFDEVDRRFDEVDRRFDRLEARSDRLESKVDHGFARIDGRIDSLCRAIMFGSVALSSAMVAGFVAILTQI
ncbi:MAG TPA: hypothetical protein VGO36_05460 [Solirubrobacterales bacterium]|jgi:hypothetical protein|nr:hypothetical protein [Solirubrobacterales bacterium]